MFFDIISVQKAMPEGQLLLPMLELIENAQTAIDDLIDVVGRSTIEAILLLFARQVAGL